MKNTIKSILQDLADGTISRRQAELYLKHRERVTELIFGSAWVVSIGLTILITTWINTNIIK